MTGKPKKISLVDEVYSSIEARIASGDLRPGDRLNIEEISKALGVSRTPVREAISRLIQFGYAEQRHNAGPSVISFSNQEIVDLCEANSIIMEDVMESLIKLEDLPELAKQLRMVFEEQKAAFEASDQIDFHRSSTEFHNIIIEFCTNNNIRKAAEYIYKQLNISTAKYQIVESNRARGLRQHEGILEAIEGSDLERAKNLMKKHNEDDAILDIFRE